MEDATPLEGSKKDLFSRSKTRAFECTQKFLDSQVSVVAWMLTKTYGRIPIDNKREK
jgi:hypothetical protein